MESLYDPSGDGDAGGKLDLRDSSVGRAPGQEVVGSIYTPDARSVLIG